MSNTTDHLRGLLRDLEQRLAKVPEAAQYTAYANHLRRTIQTTREEVAASEAMDEDKSFHRIS